MPRDFRKIRAWQQADDLVVSIYDLTQHFPRPEEYGPTSQIRRATVSVAANSVEGSSKKYLREFLQYLYHASSSLAEVEYYLHLATRLGYLDGRDRDEIEKSFRETGQSLNALLRAVERQMGEGRTEN